jgi:serine protease Do
MKKKMMSPAAAVAAATFVFSPARPVTAASPSQATTTLDRFSEELRALSEKVAPSVVQVVASGYTSSGDGKAGLFAREQSTGSGVVISADGLVVTNAHVVEGSSEIYVLVKAASTTKGASIVAPRSRRLPARLVGLDKQTDVALLEIQGDSPPPLPIGDSQELRQGQIVLAFGSPLGLENSMTLGVVSAVARQLKPEDPMIYVQTDAAVNPGNSGGPLVDTNGRMVGLNALIYSQSGGYEGIGFAVPSHIVKPVTDQLRKQGRVRRGWIGARAQTVTPTLARGLGLAQEFGVVLADVVADGPAARAGLKIGDLVLALDDRPMENARQFEVNLYRRSVGDAVSVTTQRGAAKQTVSVPVTERLEDPDRFAGMVTPERNLVQKLGILGIEIDAEVLRLLPSLRGEDGVVVAARVTFARPDGPEPGDVIYAVNGLSVRGLAELRSALDRIKSGEAAVLQVERSGQLLFLALEMD